MSGFRFNIPADAFGAGVPAAPIEIIPDKGLNKTTQPKVLVASFGDGYEQRAPDGINPLMETFNMSFMKRTRDEIDNIVAFFDLYRGTRAFDLIMSDHRVGVAPPNEKVIRVICTNYNQTYMFVEYYGCTASLKRYYSLDDWVV